MTSSTNTPHIYSSFAEFVGASDWNAYFQKKVVLSLEFADSPYTPTVMQGEYHIDTSGGDVIFNLPAGADYLNYRITNISRSGNKISLVPNGSELLYGDNATEYIYDDETLDVTWGSGGWR